MVNEDQHSTVLFYIPVDSPCIYSVSVHLDHATTVYCLSLMHFNNLCSIVSVIVLNI